MNGRIETMPGVQPSAVKGHEKPATSSGHGTPAAQAAGEQAQAGIRYGLDKAQQSAAEAFAFNQDTLAALTRSGQIWSAGLQDLSRQFVATAQATIEESMERFRALASAKSLKDAVELQSNMICGSAEKAVSETSRLTSASIKLTEQMMAPITARVGVAMEKITKAAE